MESKIEIKNCVTDYESIDKAEYDNGIKIKVFSDVGDLLISTVRGEPLYDNIFFLWVECGEKTLMMNIPIDNLELFASSILKQIKIIRKSYGDHIKLQSNLGCEV